MLKNVRTVGIVSSIATAIVVFVFAVLLIVGFWTDTSDLSYLVCLILPIFVIGITTSLHLSNDEAKKIFGLLAFIFSILYAAFCMQCYYTQLAVVRNNSLGLPPDMLKVFSFTPGSTMFSIDMLGYGFLCLSTLIMSLALPKGFLKTMSFIHGLFFIPTWIYPLLSFPQDAASVSGASYGGVIALLVWCALYLPIPIASIFHLRKLEV